MIIDFNGKKIYAETHGDGEALVMLNGIMMSTPSWTQFIPALSSRNKLILLDMLDQGQSSRMSEGYDITLQADVLKKVLDELGIKKATICGISYGASVAMNFAIKYPDYADKLILFNCVPYTSQWMRDIGKGWKLARHSPQAYYHTTIPVIYSADFYNHNPEWIAARKEFLMQHVFNNKDFLDAMDRLTDSAVAHDVRDELAGITAKTLLVGSKEDYLTPPQQQKYIRERVPGANLVVIENCGHAAMYEQPDIFTALITGFVNE
ncbi:MAG: alpha/beta hydrolase [Defluviitaleaceae bacterium]|nr:alpha/beta hydrolase [Defluviitaleaceae bacterium]